MADFDRMKMELARRSEPRATSIRYDSNAEVFVVELANSCSFAFPRFLIEGLGNARHEEVSVVEIVGAGYGLHWPLLAVDLSVMGLLAGHFGTRSHMTGPAKGLQHADLRVGSASKTAELFEFKLKSQEI